MGSKATPMEMWLRTITFVLSPPKSLFLEVASD